MANYDIHGFRIAVKGPAVGLFDKEYGWARSPANGQPNLEVIATNRIHALPTKPAGCSSGLFIPYSDSHHTLWYSPDVPLNVVLSYAESLFYWPDKSLIHASAVAKDGKAIIFTGTGNVGKTSTVLNLIGRGYQYLSDDWLVVGNGIAYPLPKTIHVFDYNLEDEETAKAVLGWKRHLYAPFFALMRWGRNHAPHRYLRYAFRIARPVFHISVKDLNPEAAISPPVPVARVYYLERKNVDSLEVSDTIDAHALAKKMPYVTLYEWHFSTREYYRYAAIYGIRAQRVEDRYAHDREIIQEGFSDVRIYRVSIPTHMDLTQHDLTELFDLE
jgi:hypothetical protein